MMCRMSELWPLVLQTVFMKEWQSVVQEVAGGKILSMLFAGADRVCSKLRGVTSNVSGLRGLD